MLAMLGGLSLHAQPVNDLFSNRLFLHDSNLSRIQSSAGATRELNEPDHAGFPGGASVWWTWIAPVSGTTLLDTIGSDYDTLLSVYTGVGVDSLSLVASDDQSGGNNTSSLSFIAVAGGRYHIAVDGFMAAAGNIVLNLSVQNDNNHFLNGARLAGSRVSLLDSNVGADTELDEPSHGDVPGGASLWWTWTPPVSGFASFDTVGSDFDTLLAIYVGSDLAFLTSLADDDDSGGAGASQLEHHVNAGVEYRIAVDGFSGATGAVKLTVQMLHDTFASRLQLTQSRFTLLDSNVANTRETNEPNHAGESGGASVWWSWTSPVSGTAHLNTLGSGFDTLLAVYSGNDLATLNPIAANDEGGVNHTSVLSFNTQAGVPYAIAVDGYMGDTGGIVLNLAVDNDNDDFANRATLSGSSFTIYDANVSATVELEEPIHADDPGGTSIWWTWTAPLSGATTIDTFGSDFPTLLAVYTGSELNALTTVAANRNSAGNNDSKVLFIAQAGTTYQIAVDGALGAKGNVALSLRIEPANDDFERASILMGSSQAVTASNFNADKQAGEPNHAGSPGGSSLWWSWTAPVSGQAIVDTRDSAIDTILAVYTGNNLSSLTLVGENDDLQAGIFASEIAFNAVAGTRYYFAADGFGGQQGTINLSVRVVHDAFADAALLPGSRLSITDSSLGATKELQEPNHAGFPGGASLWWRWIAPVSGNVELDTIGSDFDTLLAVYTGTDVADLSPIAANDDLGVGVGGVSRTTFQAASGTEYLIAVDGFGGATGSVTLNLRIDHDAFANAASLAGSHLTVVDSNVGATREASEPNHAGLPGGASLWWSWTAPFSGQTEIHTEGSVFDTTLGVYTGSDLATLALVAENDDGGAHRASRVVFTAIQGTTYYIAVDGFAGATGQIALTLIRGPFNDDFAFRIPLSGFLVTLSASSLDATVEQGEPVHGDSNSAGGSSVWWSYTAPASGTLEIETTGSEFDTLLGVYGGTSMASLTSVAQNDDNGGGRQSKVSFPATAGVTYQIAVDGYGAFQGSINLSVTLAPEVNTAPSIGLRFPADGATFDGPTPLRLQTDVFDVDGGVVTVEFFQGETLIGAATSPPFAFTTASLPPGSYSFRAEATDNLGAKTVSPTHAITVAPTFMPPVSWALEPPFLPHIQTEELENWSGIHSQPDGSQTAAVFQNELYYGTTADGTGFPVKVLIHNPLQDTSRVLLQRADDSFFPSFKVMGGILYISDSAGWVTRYDGMTTEFFRLPYDLNGDFVNAMEEFNGSLYFGTQEGRIFSQSNGGDFVLRLLLPGAITALAEWQGRLYAADREEFEFSSRIVRTDDGLSWEEVGVFNSFAFAGLVATPTHLYITAVENPFSESLSFWATSDGSAWDRIFFTEDHGRELRGNPVYFTPTGRVYYLAEGSGVVSLFSLVNGALENRVTMPHGYTSLLELDGRLYAIGAVDATTGFSSPHRIDRLGIYTQSVAGNLPPTVSILNPPDGDRAASGSDMVIQVAANDPDGSVASVAFLIDDQVQAVISDAPYEFHRNNVSPGIYRIAARARDNNGAVTLSETVTFAVGPANDNFANRIPLTGAIVSATGANRFATLENNEPSHGGNIGGSSVWWTWTAPFTGLVAATTERSSFDTLLGVYRGASVNALTLLAGNDDGASDRSSLVVFRAVAGNQYSFAVDGFHGDAGDILLRIRALAANDSFAAATTLTGVSSSVQGSNLGASKEAGEPNHAGNPGGRSVWWKWTAPSGGNVTIDTRGSLIDTLLSVYTGAALPGLALIAENDQDPDQGNSSIVSFNVTAGTTYNIAVDGYFADQGGIVLTLALDNLNDLPSVQIVSPTPGIVFTPPGNFTVTAQAADTDGTISRVYFFLGADLYSTDDTAPYTADFFDLPGGNHRISAVAKDNLNAFSEFHRVVYRVGSSNDDFQNRLDLGTTSGTLAGSNLGATKETAEPLHDGKPDGSSVWYRLNLQENSRVSINLEKSAFDTLLAIYTGAAVNSLTPVISDDDGGGDLTSAVDFIAIAGVDYSIAVDGYDGASGQIQLQWTISAATSEPPRIIQQPASYAGSIGGNATFSVVATSVSKLNYQWTHNRVAMMGQTNRILTINGLSAANVGIYRVVVATEEGQAAISEPVTLEIGTVANVFSRNKLRELEAPGGPSPQNSKPKKETLIPVSVGVLGTQVFSNFDSGRESAEPLHAGQAGGSSRWFTIQAATSGTIVVDTIGSSIDTVLAVYTGSGFLDLRLIKSDDNGAPDRIRSKLNFVANAGTVYQAVVDGVQGEQGTVSLNWLLLSPIQIQPPTTTNGQFRLHFQGDPNVVYVVQSSSNLIDWNNFSTNQSATGEITVSAPVPAGPAQMMYRVKVVP